MLEEVADSLWTSHASLNTISAPRSDILSAVDVLTSPSLPESTCPPNTNTDDARPEKQSKNSLLFSEDSEVGLHPSHSSPYGTNPQTRVQHPRFLQLKNKPQAASHQHRQQSQSLPQSQHPNSLSLGSVSSPVQERLALATRNSVRESLLHLGALKVLSWRSGAADVCVKVGIETMWSADVSLDSLDPENSVLLVHSIDVNVASHPDSPGNSFRIINPITNSSQPSFSSAQQTVLRTLANERISAAVNTARTLAKPDQNAHFTSVALCALRDMMLDDVCAPLSMSLLRAQARALAKGPWSSFVSVQGAEVTSSRSTALEISYWADSMSPATIRFAEFQTANQYENVKTSTESDRNPALSKPSRTGNFACEKPVCVTCEQEPPLPTAIELGRSSTSYNLRSDSLNIEHALLFAIRARSRARLNAISQAFITRHIHLRLHPSCVHLGTSSPGNPADFFRPPLEDVLQIYVGDEPVGIDVRIFPLTGGLRIRPYGAAALAFYSRNTEQLEGVAPWSGARKFSSKGEEIEAIVGVFEMVRARVKLNSSARAVCALDIGVSNTLPPGTASVAATASPERAASQLVPPFAPLERRGPRRFLTLSPPPPVRDLFNRWMPTHSKMRMSGTRNSDRNGPAKRPRLTYATTSDALVFIQESSFAGEDWSVGPRYLTSEDGKIPDTSKSKKQYPIDMDSTDRYTGSAGAAAAWAVTREVVERRLRRDSLLRAFVGSNVASAAQTSQTRSSESGDLHLDSASRILLKVKCEPLPVRKAELLLRGYDAWQVRLSLLPSIFDDTDCLRDNENPQNGSVGFSMGGNLWSVGVACVGSQLTFTYPSANTETVRSFFRDLTRARTAAALARGVPPSQFYQVIRRSPVRIVVGIGPFRPTKNGEGSSYIRGQLGGLKGGSGGGSRHKPLYTATVEYVYSKGNSGGFSLSFSPPKKTMEDLAPLIEEALDASGGQVGSILAGLLERACPVAAAAESAVREKGDSKIRFVTALRIRAIFGGIQKAFGKSENGGGKGTGPAPVNGTHKMNHAVDVDARGGSGMVTVIDVGRATSVMIQQGLAHRSGWNNGSTSQKPRADFVAVPKWDEIVDGLALKGLAQAQRAGSTVLLRMEVLEQFLSELVDAARWVDPRISGSAG